MVAFVVSVVPRTVAVSDLARLRQLMGELESRRPWQIADQPTPPPSGLVGEDSRRDLPGSELWGALLQLASADAGDPLGVYGRLHAARCCGAVLERRSGKWKLAPTIDPTERLSVWESREAWDRDAANWLLPRSCDIVKLLTQLPSPSEPTDT